MQRCRACPTLARRFAWRTLSRPPAAPTIRSHGESRRPGGRWVTAGPRRHGRRAPAPPGPEGCAPIPVTSPPRWSGTSCATGAVASRVAAVMASTVAAGAVPAAPDAGCRLRSSGPRRTPRESWSPNLGPGLGRLPVRCLHHAPVAHRDHVLHGPGHVVVVGDEHDGLDRRGAAATGVRRFRGRCPSRGPRSARRPGAGWAGWPGAGDGQTLALPTPRENPGRPWPCRPPPGGRGGPWPGSRRACAWCRR